MTPSSTSAAGRTALITAFLALVVSLVPHMLHGQEPRTVNQPVYSDAQAARGQKTFEGTCTACHDTARFTGPEFVNAWAGQPLHALFDTVSSTMPEDNPGSLELQQYGDIIAFFLKLNGYPSGPDELKGDEASMKAIKMEAKK